MHNCFKVLINRRLYGIFHTEQKALFTLNLVVDEYQSLGITVENFEVIPIFIEGIGF